MECRTVSGYPICGYRSAMLFYNFLGECQSQAKIVYVVRQLFQDEKYVFAVLIVKAYSVISHFNVHKVDVFALFFCVFVTVVAKNLGPYLNHWLSIRRPEFDG